MIEGTTETGSETESTESAQSTEHRPRGWRKVAIWLIGAALLAVVGYRGALGTREPAAVRPPIHPEDRAAAPQATSAHAAPARTEPSGPPSSTTQAAVAPPPGTAAPTGTAGPDSTVAPSGTSAPVGAATGAGARGAPATRGTAVPTDPGGAPDGAGQAITTDGRIVLNLATEAELRKLPGIGKSRARAILEHREKLGRFRRLEDLLRVKGIGPKRLAVLRAKVVLDAPR
jgi:competence protein ComEA